MAVLILSDEGEIEKDSLILEERKSPFGIDIKPGTWHAVVALEESVLYEVKGQPNEGYIEDKEFAPFAPKEGSPESAEYLEKLKKEIKKRF
ncbi:MAG: hypothetical protein HYV77_02965 [Candidatus Wildermuthbacteria bacterium]|nr:hypothetical protein [Candidatus Wildermuthbacteria bacterium]